MSKDLKRLTYYTRMMKSCKDITFEDLQEIFEEQELECILIEYYKMKIDKLKDKMSTLT